jgi:hypothetical protein
MSWFVTEKVHMNMDEGATIAGHDLTTARPVVWTGVGVGVGCACAADP